MTTEPETTLEPDNNDEGGDTIDPVEQEAVLAELGVSDETIDATPDEIVALIARLAAQANTAEDGRMRALADFRNFQRRSIENEGRARKEGLSGVVRSLLPALDHFDLALQSVGASATIEQVVTGVGMVRGEIVRALESNGVTILTAEPGTTFEPGQHEAVGVKPFEAGDENLEVGSVAISVSPGYAMGDVVLRPAKVMLVAEPPTD